MTHKLGRRVSTSSYSTVLGALRLLSWFFTKHAASLLGATEHEDSLLSALHLGSCCLAAPWFPACTYFSTLFCDINLTASTNK